MPEKVWEVVGCEGGEKEIIRREFSSQNFFRKNK